MKNYPFKIFRHVLPGLAMSLPATLVLATISFSSYAGTPVPILPGQGVSFAQVDYVYTNNFMVESNSDTGQMLVSPDAVRSATGKTSGYLNVLSTEGWVVHNLPLLADFSSSNILCAALKLPTPPGVRLTWFNANVQISDVALTSFSGPCTISWSVGKTTCSTTGLTHNPMIGPDQSASSQYCGGAGISPRRGGRRIRARPSERAGSPEPMLALRRGQQPAMAGRHLRHRGSA